MQGWYAYDLCLSATVVPKALKTSTRIIIISSKSRNDRGTMHSSSAYNTPEIARLEVDKVGEDVRILTEALQRDEEYRGAEDVENQGR